MESEIIYKYFPELTEVQRRQIDALGELYSGWNEKINVISRKDIGNLYPRHVLHSLALAKFFGPLQPDTSFIDIGTGGGFPGIPLAIIYPQCQFHLVDRIGKKIRVATEVAQAIGLENVTFQHGDIGECKLRADYVISRAVMPLNDLLKLVRKNIKPLRDAIMGNIQPPGLVCLKGSDISGESAGIRGEILNTPIATYIPEEFFADKSIVAVSLFS